MGAKSKLKHKVKKRKRPDSEDSADKVNNEIKEDERVKKNPYASEPIGVSKKHFDQIQNEIEISKEADAIVDRIIEQKKRKKELEKYQRECRIKDKKKKFSKSKDSESKKSGKSSQTDKIDSSSNEEMEDKKEKKKKSRKNKSKIKSSNKDATDNSSDNSQVKAESKINIRIKKQTKSNKEFESLKKDLLQDVEDNSENTILELDKDQSGLPNRIKFKKKKVNSKNKKSKTQRNKLSKSSDLSDITDKEDNKDNLSASKTNVSNRINDEWALGNRKYFILKFEGVLTYLDKSLTPFRLYVTNKKLHKLVWIGVVTYEYHPVDNKVKYDTYLLIELSDTDKLSKKPLVERGLSWVDLKQSPTNNLYWKIKSGLYNPLIDIEYKLKYRFGQHAINGRLATDEEEKELNKSLKEKIDKYINENKEDTIQEVNQLAESNSHINKEDIEMDDKTNKIENMILDKKVDNKENNKIEGKEDNHMDLE